MRRSELREDSKKNSAPSAYNSLCGALRKNVFIVSLRETDFFTQSTRRKIQRRELREDSKKNSAPSAHNSLCGALRKNVFIASLRE
jgi:hypothetical protein